MDLQPQAGRRRSELAAGRNRGLSRCRGMGRKRRLLSRDDAAVWQAVTRTVTPLTAAKPPPGDNAAGTPAGNSPPVIRTPAPTPEPRAPFSFRPRQEPPVS